MGEGEIYDEEIYENTKEFILSKDNPYYYEGRFAQGIGSPHTPRGNIWHMSMIMEALLSDDEDRQLELVRQIMKTTEKTVYGSHGLEDGTMHESFDPNSPQRYTRSWFAWADTLF